MHPLKALRSLLSPTSVALSGVVVSTSPGQLIVATSQGRQTIATDSRIPPGTQVTISDGTVTVSPSKITRYPV